MVYLCLNEMGTCQVCICGSPSCGLRAKDKEEKAAKEESFCVPRFVSSSLEGTCGPGHVRTVAVALLRCLHPHLDSVPEHPDQFHRRGFE